MYGEESKEALGDQFPFVEGWITPSGIFEEEKDDEECES